MTREMESLNKKSGAPSPLGLALSGGGFRAAAFHLGVLKRLRELGILEKVSFLSTVSGGSILGAAWTYWQILRGDTINDLTEWNAFEKHFVDVMRRGFRGRIFWRAFFLPLVFFYTTMLSITFLDPLASAKWPVTIIYSVPPLMAYLIWHYRASSHLARLYDREFFHGARISHMRPEPKSNKYSCPQLIINATGLNAGEHLVFSNIKGFDLVASFLRDLLSGARPPRAREPVYLSREASVADAVAASSALPGVFAPLRIPWAFAEAYKGSFLRKLMHKVLSRHYLAVDGGVFDNQGIQVLLNENCASIIVSDAAAALKHENRPRTWQFWPFGNRKGVLFRSQDIVFERVRELGYQLLKTHQALFRSFKALSEHMAPNERILAHLQNWSRPKLESYLAIDLGSDFDLAPDCAPKLPDLGQFASIGSVELSYRIRMETVTGVTHEVTGGLTRSRPKDDLPLAPPRLPDSIRHLVRTIRTDLDRFSPIEISALIFHGYTLVDHHISENHPNWIAKDAPLNFSLSRTELNVDWANLTEPTRTLYVDHLRASRSRVFLWRLAQRILKELIRRVSALGMWRLAHGTLKKLAAWISYLGLWKFAQKVWNKVARWVSARG